MPPVRTDTGAEPNLDALQSEMGHVQPVQEYVPGEEHAFWTLYDDGDPVATCQKHQVTPAERASIA